jgi:catechol 2,3-dioxygenase-like lactoylglutathione lyase family enzyme
LQHHRFARLGEPHQFAFVSRDPEPLLRQWTEVVGAGPFFAIPDLRFNYSLYRGTPQDITIDAYVGYWGDRQIEVIRPHDDTPSVYTEWLTAGRSGLHHIAILVDSLDAARATAGELGLSITQESAAYNGEPFFYVDVGSLYLEIICPDAGMKAFFDMMRQAHAEWDGRDPVRAAPADEINRGAAQV